MWSPRCGEHRGLNCVQTKRPGCFVGRMECQGGQPDSAPLVSGPTLLPMPNFSFSENIHLLMVEILLISSKESQQSEKIPTSRKRIIIFATETEPILVEFLCLYHHVTIQVLGTAKPLSHHFLSRIPTVFYSQNSFVIVSSEKKIWMTDGGRRRK